MCRSGRELGIIERAVIAIDQNGSVALRRVANWSMSPTSPRVDFPFPERLAAQGLRSLVVSPLLGVEG